MGLLQIIDGEPGVMPEGVQGLVAEQSPLVKTYLTKVLPDFAALASTIIALARPLVAFANLMVFIPALAPPGRNGTAVAVMSYAKPPISITAPRTLPEEILHAKESMPVLTLKDPPRRFVFRQEFRNPLKTI